MRLTVFWIVHLIVLGLFGLELLWVVSAWLKARVPGLPADAPRGKKLAAVLRLGAGLVFSRRLGALLKALVADGLVHRRLYRIDRRRWAAHAAVFGAWLLLGLLSILTGFVVEILPRLGLSAEQVASLPVIGPLYHADVWWVALLNELLGLVALAGMVWVIYRRYVRRYVRRDPQLRTLPADSLVIALLTLIALSGFPTETFRLLADYTTAAGAFAPDPSMLAPERFPAVLIPAWGPQWGLVGYLSARLLGGLGLEAGVWGTLHGLSFWLHVALASVLLFCLPFSRFFHTIMSPVVAAYNTARAGWGQSGP